MSRFRQAWLVCFLTAGAAALAAANSTALAEQLLLLPENVELSTSAAKQRLLLQQLRGRQVYGQLRDSVEMTTSDPQVVRVEQGVLVPVGDGTAVITARHQQQTATTRVVVRGQDEPFVWNFRNHVESVFSKTGCNSGACHGARAGQKGFRLSLFGYDPQADYAYLTRQAKGRRMVLSDPGRSLFLTKSTGLIPHKGGVRLEVDSPEYRVLADWVGAGAPGPRVDDPAIDRVEVLPKHSVQEPGAVQQLIVLAHFDDGHVEDVTRWAKYTSEDQSVASVGQWGAVQITGPGEGAVKVWYLNRNALAFLSVPYPEAPAADTFAQFPPRNFLDRAVREKLRSLNLPPSPPADDGTFLRRAYLDTIGVLPTADETRRFLADRSEDKRDRVIDHLLSRPEFVDYWSYKWSDLLLVSGQRLRPQAVKAYYQWIRQQVAANVPWDRFVRDVVTASGSTFENGAANYYALHQTPEEMAETTAQAFLGLSINCARCHNHPLEKWTNDQYYGMANMFARVRAKGWGGDYRSDAFKGERIVFSDVRGELIQPGVGRPQPPRPLDAPPVSFDDTSDRRRVMAQWLTSADNPYFAKSIVNRVWANYFGVGLKEKVDDMRVTNPASNEALLDAAAKYLVEQKFDLQQFMRAILRSATYQRSSAVADGNAADQRFYSRFYPRRLKAEVLLDAISQVSGAPSKFKDHPAGTRALQLPDANTSSYFLDTFGRPDRLITCDCERSDEPSMTQVLHLYNGNTLNAKLREAGNRLRKQVEAGASDESIIEDLFLEALSRWPTAREKDQLLTHFRDASQEDRVELLEDVYWSVLSSREFLFNH